MSDRASSKKPRLRGVSHLVAFFIACVGGMVLVANTPSPRAALAAGIYASSLALLFGMSALYHCPPWSPKASRALRRIDLSFIFLLIAGTYTPFCMLSVPGALGKGLLIAIWLLAAVGIAKSILWTRAPRMITAGVYVAVGCLALPFMPQLVGTVPPTTLLLVMTGGGLYIIGAVVYALRLPDLAPSVFGYHEVFHAFVVAAGVCHFIAVANVVSAGAVV
jgi:hemolysin III